MTFVVDASVAVKWLFPEPHAEAASRLLKPGRKLLAPDILWAEVASATCKKVRRDEISPDQAAEMLRDFRLLPIRTYPAKTLIQTAWRVALEAGISVYDGLYLSLAYSQDSPLVTADRKFYDKIFDAYPQSETLWIEDFKA